VRTPSAAIATRINNLIDPVQREVLAAIGGEGPVWPDDVAYAKDTVALGVARYIENSAFPEQNDAPTTGVAFHLGSRYTEHITNLTGRCQRIVIA
jgi:hypothetical protein